MPNASTVHALPKFEQLRIALLVLLALDRLLADLLTGHLEVQRGRLALLQLVAEVAPVRRVAVVLDVPTARGVGQPVPEGALPRLLQRRLDVLRAGGQRLRGALALALEQAPDAVLCVVPRDDLAAGALDRRDGRRRHPRHHDVDGRVHRARAPRQELDAVLGPADEARLDDLLGRDLLRRVEPPRVDPVLQPVQVDLG